MVIPAKKSSKGMRNWQMVESFVPLSGLEELYVYAMMRMWDDDGLAVLLCYWPYAEMARQWPNMSHDEALLGESLQGQLHARGIESGGTEEPYAPDSMGVSGEYAAGGAM